MSQGARTPEELETLFEDAFVVRDGEALRRLFEDGAVLAAGSGAEVARGGEAIERLACVLWQRGRTYVAEPRHVLQARDTALVLAHELIALLALADEALEDSEYVDFSPTHEFQPVPDHLTGAPAPADA